MNGYSNEVNNTMIRYVRLRRLVLKKIDVLTFVVGFAIGAGILGLPVKFGTSGAGFIPSAVMLLVTLLFQIITAIYVVEGIDALGPGEFPNLMKKSLGSWASISSYIFIALYLIGAMTAYIVFGGEAIHTLTRGLIPDNMGMILYWLLGVAITIGGARIIARAEETMVAMIMLLLAINVLLCLSTPYVSIENLLWGDWSKALSVFGIVLFAYAIHSAIPTAYRTFGVDEKYDRILALGLSVSALVYLVWSAAYMSILAPEDYTKTFTGALTGEEYHGIAGLPAPIAVAELGKLKTAALLGYIFGFFTTLTSFIAAAHSLYQINIEALKTRALKQKHLILLATTIPPLILAIANLGSFTEWLNFAGAIGAGFFTGILPCLLAIKLRLHKPENWKPLLPGGIPLAIATLLFYILGITWYIIHP